MRLVGENAFKQSGRVRANGLRPMHHARRCPFQMRLVGPWAVFGNGDGVSMATCTQVRSHALTLIEDLDGRRCRAHFHEVVHQVVRHAVVVRIKSDVVIDVDSGAGPLAEIERARREEDSAPVCLPPRTAMLASLRVCETAAD